MPPATPSRDQQGRLFYDPDGQPIPGKNVEERGGIAVYKNRWNPVLVDAAPPAADRSPARPVAAAARAAARGLAHGRATPTGLGRACRWYPRCCAPTARPIPTATFPGTASEIRFWTSKPKSQSSTPTAAPFPFASAFPLLRSDDDPLTEKVGGDVLYARFPSEDELRIVYGSDVLQISEPRFMWSNYIRVLRDKDIKFSLYGWNSLFVAVCVMIGQVVTSAMAGFAFARLEWRYRDAVFLLYLATLMVPWDRHLAAQLRDSQKPRAGSTSFQALIVPGHVHRLWHLYDAPVYDRAAQRARRGR